MCVALEHLHRLMARDSSYFLVREPILDQSGDRLMAEIVEMKIDNFDFF